MANIYELDSQLDWLESLELDEETEHDTLEAIIEDVGLEKIMNNIAWANSNDKASMTAINAEIAKLKDKKESAVQRVKRRNEIGYKVLSRLKNKKIKTDFYSFWIQNNPVTTNYDESKIPDSYFVEIKQLDKEAIKQALKSGEVIEGVTQTQTEGLKADER